MKNFLLSSLTKALNAYLALDAESEQRFQSLAGKVLTIELLPFHFIFQMVFTEQGVELQAEECLVAAAKIRGTPLQFVGMMIAGEERQRFFAEDILLEGDAELGQQVVELFDRLEIDWEEYLARVIGDAPAYQVSRGIGSMKKWLRQAGESLRQDGADYLHEEKNWFPTKEALADFFDEIDGLRMDVDRIEAKLQQLRKWQQEDTE